MSGHQVTKHLALRDKLANGRQEDVKTIFTSLSADEQLRIADQELESLHLADERTFDIATDMLKVIAPLLRGVPRQHVQKKLRHIRDTTSFREILRCTINILWELDSLQEHSSIVRGVPLLSQSMQTDFSTSGYWT